VGDLETLKAVGRLGLAPDNIENGVNELGTCANHQELVVSLKTPGHTLGIVTLCPIVTSTALPEHAI